MATYVTFVLDETGSMSSCKEETIAGFNLYIKELQKELKDVKFSFMKFDSQEMNWVYKDVDIAFVKKLKKDTYIPRSFTPLWDAFGLAIQYNEEKEFKKKDKIIITILTDGQENASEEFDAKSVGKLVKKHKDWAINFLGANMDAFGDVGQQIYMTQGSTMTFNQDDMVGAFSGVGASTVAYAKGETTVDNFYDGDGVVELENFDSEPE